jgi:phosphopantothenoylcysteine decarboxylase/phosphopantothenate--cysteine ligase
MLHDKRILLIISGGIAAYKSLDLIRRLRERGAAVRCILTPAAQEFVTPLSVSALSGDRVYGELFSLTDEHEMGHIQLSRDADLVLVAPATANILARMAHGIADDLATTALIATDKPVMVAPAMNVRMWEHPATRDNMATLNGRGVSVIGPDKGDMACGEYGDGRMAEPMEITDAVIAHFGSGLRLSGRRALVTSGPTFEALDPVRYLANRSSGKQGHAIAAAFAGLGAETILVTGPTNETDPPGVAVVRIESARQMLDACRAALPVDVAVCAAAVTDWRPAEMQGEKIKRNGRPAALALTENPDILATLAAAGNERPAMVIGFAAETGAVVKKAIPKRRRKGCDWIVANDVSPGTETFGGTENTVHLVTADGAESWPKMTKSAVARRLAAAVADHLEAAEGGGA